MEWTIASSYASSPDADSTPPRSRPATPDAVRARASSSASAATASGASSRRAGRWAKCLRGPHLPADRGVAQLALQLPGGAECRAIAALLVRGHRLAAREDGLDELAGGVGAAVGGVELGRGDERLGGGAALDEAIERGHRFLDPAGARQRPRQQRAGPRVVVLWVLADDVLQVGDRRGVVADLERGDA